MRSTKRPSARDSVRVDSLRTESVKTTIAPGTPRLESAVTMRPLIDCARTPVGRIAPNSTARTLGTLRCATLPPQGRLTYRLSLGAEVDAARRTYAYGRKSEAPQRCLSLRRKRFPKMGLGRV